MILINGKYLLENINDEKSICNTVWPDETSIHTSQPDYNYTYISDSLQPNCDDFYTGCVARAVFTWGKTFRWKGKRKC